MDPLADMTPERWRALSYVEQQRMRDLSQLLPQLDGLEGYRVEVVDMDGQTRRFIVGRSTGWRPIHLEVNNRRSLGGMGADSRGYQSVRTLYKARD